MGEISFGQIAADAEGIMSGTYVSPGVASQEMNGSVNPFTKKKIETAENRLTVSGENIQVDPTLMSPDFTSKAQRSSEFVVNFSGTA